MRKELIPRECGIVEGPGRMLPGPLNDLQQELLVQKKMIVPILQSSIFTRQPILHRPILQVFRYNNGLKDSANLHFDAWYVNAPFVH